jgi:hypothetical protein
LKQVPPPRLLAPSAGKNPGWIKKKYITYEAIVSWLRNASEEKNNVVEKIILKEAPTKDLLGCEEAKAGGR